MKFNCLILFFCALCTQLFGQTFHLYENNKFGSRKITVVKFAPDTLEIKCNLNPSERCACAGFEIYKLTKNANGNYLSQDNQVIEANIYDGKIKSFIVKGNRDYHCCEVWSGIYLVKPTPPSGSTTTPKLSSVNAAPKAFYDFWNAFQIKMNNTDSIKPFIHFPYAIKSNSLYDYTQISATEFQEYGVDIFVNGNAFIGTPFATFNYPKSKGLFISPLIAFENDAIPYINEDFIAFFKRQYGSLDQIYIVAELAHYFEEGGYKAYFRAYDGTFEFIGFEGMEQGD